MTSTLQDIRLKVRRVTKSPSTNQITDPQIDQYVNTFYIYDFPEHLRLFDLHTNLTIVTAPNIDTYDLPTSSPTDLPPTFLGNLTGTTNTINLFTALGIPVNATVVPGSVNVTVNNTQGSTFTDNLNPNPPNGTMTGTVAGETGMIDYVNCILELNFSLSNTAAPSNIAFDYSVPEFITISPPLYIAGYQSHYTQSQQEFYRAYPKITTLTALTYGNATTGPFTGTLQAVPVLRNNVLVNTLDVSGNSMALQDDGLGNLTGNGTGTINYVTGAISVTFSQAVLSGQAINTQTVPYVANRPSCALYFNDQLTLRPVPDQAYTVELEGYKRPTALLASNSAPQLREWWQLLAMGASLKIFEDRGDHTSIQQYMPIFQQYMSQAVRKTIVQQTVERTSTIYTEQTNPIWGNFFGNF